MEQADRNQFSLFARSVALCLGVLCAGGQAVAEERFEDYEIRVIRPKFMKKRGRVELAGQMTVVMNQSFIYSVLASGLLDYHFSEALALEVGGAYGFSIDKEDKRILKDEFVIETQILRTQYIAQGGVLWTPIYGKTQLSSGKVVYFDTFFSAGAGITGIEYTYDQCKPSTSSSSSTETSVPAATTTSYPTLVLGVGQKFFLTKDLGLRWDVRDHIFSYNSADGSCTPDGSGESKIHQNVTLQLGASTFF